MSRPLVAHLTSKATIELLRRSADRMKTSGYGARIFAWRKVVIIIETRKEPKRLLPIDGQVPWEELFTAKPSEESL